MARSARLVGRLVVGMLTVVLLLGWGQEALAGEPIHDPKGHGFPVPSAPLVGGPRVGTTARQDFGWMMRGAAVAALAVAVLIWLLAWAGRLHAHALPRPR